MKPELFLLSKELIKATSFSEVQATYADMEELGIAKLPYPDIDVGAHMVAHRRHDGTFFLVGIDDLEEGVCTCCDRTLKGGILCDVRHCYRGGEWHETLMRICDTDDEWRRPYVIDSNDKARLTAQNIKKVLIVLLATKNVSKIRTKDKLAALGIGSNKKHCYRPVYTTTLSLFTCEEPWKRDAATAPRTSLRPHLRRGHIRRQRHGPNCEFVKKIWVEPCFVNGDDSFVPRRESYNVRMPVLDVQLASPRGQ